MSTLNVVVIPDKVTLADGSIKTMYSAFGLEHFIAAQGDTVELALDSLERTVHSTLAANEALGQAPLFGIKPAPAAYLALGAADGQKLPTQVHHRGTINFSLAPVVVSKPEAA